MQPCTRARALQRTRARGCAPSFVRARLVLSGCERPMTSSPWVECPALCRRGRGVTSAPSSKA
eukprot:7377362-Prymnesium_polylepis.1